MITRMLAVFVSCTLLAAKPPQSDAAKDDLKKLQGTWKVASVEAGGMELKDVKLGQLTFKDNTVAEFGKETTFKLDASKKPKEIDLILGKDGKTWLGVYDLDGDKLRLCLALVEKGKGAEQKRPADFDKDKPQMLITMTRARP